MSKTADVLIVGAGIIGAACAHELARAGLRVRVIDARLRGATQAGMGHLVVMDDNPAELALSGLSLALWHDWGPRLGKLSENGMPNCAYARPGTLWIAADEEERAEAERKAARLRAAGIACEWLDAAALAKAEPTLRTGLAGGLRVPGDGIIYAPNAAECLLAAQAGHVEVEQALVRSIDDKGVNLADGQRRDAACVLLAAGAQTPRLCPELPIEPKKGHLAITDRYPGMVRHQLVELGYVKSAHHSTGTSVACNVQPRPTGQLLIGSSRQFNTEDPAVEPAILARMLRQARSYVPGLADCNVIRTWTGFRAATPDGLPIIGRHPWRDTLWLAVGHEGLGVTTAPATAQLIAALMSGAVPPLAAEPYAAARFALKAPS